MKNLIVVSCAALLFSSCSEDAKAPDGAGIDLNNDRALRAHLEVDSLSGSVVVPEDARAFVVTTLEYEDGELVGQGHIIQGHANPEQYPYISVQLLWGEVDGKQRSTLATPGVTSREVGDFWSKVGAGSSWGGHASQHEVFEGYRVIGTSWSGEARVGHENSGAGGNMEWSIKTRKHVGALVAKFFPTMEEATEHVEMIRKQRDERRKAAKAGEDGYLLVELEYEGGNAAYLAAVVRETGFGPGRAVVHDEKASVYLTSRGGDDLERAEAEVRAKERQWPEGVRVMRVAWKLGALPEAPEQKEVPIVDVSLDRERKEHFGISSADVTRVLQEFREVYPDRSTEGASAALLEVTVETAGGELVPLKAFATLVRQQGLRPIVLDLPCRQERGPVWAE